MALSPDITWWRWWDPWRRRRLAAITAKQRISWYVHFNHDPIDVSVAYVIYEVFIGARRQ